MIDETDFSVVAFGETERKDFPLILVFGRESNGSNKVVPGISIYDETVSSGSAFWNRSLKFVQRCSESSKHLRDESVQRKSGPVIFTNAFPHPILNSVQNKDSIRSSLGDQTVSEHINNVFSLDIINRVRLVIFSTGPKEMFRYSRGVVHSLCKLKSIKFVEVPYFANPYVNNQELDESIKIEEKKAIKTIVDEYYEST